MPTVGTNDNEIMQLFTVRSANQGESLTVSTNMKNITFPYKTSSWSTY